MFLLSLENEVPHTMTDDRTLSSDWRIVASPPTRLIQCPCLGTNPGGQSLTHQHFRGDTLRYVEQVHKRQNEKSKKVEEAQLEEFVVTESIGLTCSEWEGGVFRVERIKDADNSWEPEKNLDCSELTEAFLNFQKAGKRKDGTKRKSLSDSESDDRKS
ncbi:Chromobox protein-3 [Galemys pyrenaicus]|uniref:Chromobox protein-3 n=1 Tax=Galemys pyrenaicus TaxID=202257 RepID=A0A8J6AWJ1_GALPY|nr:Chromobox protein-3 [Galemys pyrenaicus]